MTKTVLSLDGGGVRALAGIEFLKRLEDTLPQPLADSFDLVGGTSAGAIVGCGISALRANGRQLEAMFGFHTLERFMPKSLWDKKLSLLQNKPKYSGAEKAEILQTFFGDRPFASTRMPTVVTAYDIGSRRPLVLCSDEEKHLTLLEVLEATSAAPLYFPPVKVRGKYLVDGSLVANNPTMTAYCEAKKRWPDERIRILSIGTGISRRKMDGKTAQTWGIVGWIGHGLLDVMVEGPMVHEQATTLLGEDYLRVNSDLGEVKSEMDDTSLENHLAIVAMGKRWYEQYEARVTRFMGPDS